MERRVLKDNMDRKSANQLLEKLGVLDNFTPLLESGDGVLRFERALDEVLKEYEQGSSKAGPGVYLPAKRKGTERFFSLKDFALAISEFKRHYGVCCEEESDEQIALLDYGVSAVALTKLREEERREGRRSAEVRMILSTRGSTKSLQKLKQRLWRDDYKALDTKLARQIIEAYGTVQDYRWSGPINRKPLVRRNVEYVEGLLKRRVVDLWDRAL